MDCDYLFNDYKHGKKLITKLKSLLIIVPNFEVRKIKSLLRKKRIVLLFLASKNQESSKTKCVKNAADSIHQAILKHRSTNRSNFESDESK